MIIKSLSVEGDKTKRKMKYLLGERVLTEYYEHEVFIVVGIREKELELEGDWSGGTHNVLQKSWYPIEKVKPTV